MINLCIFYNNKNIIFNGIFLSTIYLLISERKDKKILINNDSFCVLWCIVRIFIIKKSKLQS